MENEETVKQALLKAWESIDLQSDQIESEKRSKSRLYWIHKLFEYCRLSKRHPPSLYDIDRIIDQVAEADKE